jgi:hypothetical protein
VHVPGWHDATKDLQQAGRLRMAGIIQEQHPDRAWLFMQWKQMDWPILVDSLNLAAVTAVPITLAIDEHGIVRAINPRKETIVADFLSKQFEPPRDVMPAPAAQPVIDVIPPRGSPPEAWRRYAERLFLWGGTDSLTRTIDGFEKSLASATDAAATHFRQGVAFRARYDSAGRRPGDFRRAIEHWQRALDLDPNQYIWRRRIQQYGPRLDKPYPFYDWVPEARAAILKRGGVPVPLTVEPAGAEIARPARTFEIEAAAGPEPDPRGRIHRDRGEFVAVEAVVVPAAVAPGASARAHVVFRPNLARKAHWNNEADDLIVWINPPAGWQVDARRLSVRIPPEPVSQEARRVELELRVPESAATGTVSIPAYALYYVCEDVDGTCLYRRQDVKIEARIRRRQ